jgi:hypothetical protein
MASHDSQLDPPLLPGDDVVVVPQRPVGVLPLQLAARLSMPVE